jgi:hypothetical protein
VVSNRPGAALLPGPTDGAYAARCERESRNQEFSCDRARDRLSDHRFLANSFRLYLHAAAMNLLVRLRRFIAEPLPALALQAETASPTSQPGEAALAADSSLWRSYGDLALQAEAELVQLAAGSNLLLAEALQRKLQALKAELGGRSSSPLERLLVERVSTTGYRSLTTIACRPRRRGQARPG